MYRLIVRRLILSVVIYLYVECVTDAKKDVAKFDDVSKNIVNELQLWNHATAQRILSDAYKISAISPTTIRNDDIVTVIFE